jgi:hypothetical protein
MNAGGNGNFYVRLSYNGVELRTTTQNNLKNPEWNEGVHLFFFFIFFFFIMFLFFILVEKIGFLSC